MKKENKDSIILILFYIILYALCLCMYISDVIKIENVLLYVLVGGYIFNEIIKFVNHFPSILEYNEKK